MTISLATYRTPTTNTLDSLFDSLFDPFFESVTIPRKRTITEGTLTIQTKKTDTEFGTSAFMKTWTLPEGTTADKISADYHQGILRVTVEKPEVTVPKTVTIKVS
jgi:hypothetical protein